MKRTARLVPNPVCFFSAFYLRRSKICGVDAILQDGGCNLYKDFQTWLTTKRVGLKKRYLRCTSQAPLSVRSNKKKKNHTHLTGNTFEKALKRVLTFEATQKVKRLSWKKKKAQVCCLELYIERCVLKFCVVWLIQYQFHNTQTNLPKSHTASRDAEKCWKDALDVQKKTDLYQSQDNERDKWLQHLGIIRVDEGN